MTIKVKMICCAAMLVACGTWPASGDEADLQFFGLNTAASIDANLDALNGVRDGEKTPAFDRVSSGVTPDGRASVLLGSKNGQIEYLSVQVTGAGFRSIDRAAIIQTERIFGLDGGDRTIGECGTAFDEDCTALFYSCPEAPPVCRVTVVSNGIAAGRPSIRIYWRKEAFDITSN